MAFYIWFPYCNFIYAVYRLTCVTALRSLVQVGEPSVADEQALIQSYTYVAATTNIHPYLSNIVNYAQAVKFLGFEEAEGKSALYCLWFGRNCSIAKCVLSV